MKATAVIAAVLASVSVNAAVIQQVIVRQQWPWSTDIKVEYKVTGVTSPVNIAVRAFNGATELPSANLESSMKGQRFGIAEDGVGTFVIDPVKAFGTSKVALANFKVKLSLTPAAENVNEVIYKVFDLTTGKCKDLTRADFYNGNVEEGDYVTDYTKIHPTFLAPTGDIGDILVWTGVTNNVKYKTTHLVMRKIPAANKIWSMGAPKSEPGYRAASETNHLVKLTQDFFIGVFELTQKQYTLVTGSNPSSAAEQAREEADVLPVSNLFFGGENANNSAMYCVAKLRQQTGCEGFGLPTEAQWEYAGRAGSTTGYYSGLNPSTANIWSNNDPNGDRISWFAGNSGGKSHAVGLKAPNAFGLYDMIGNVYEFATDMYSADAAYVASFGSGWQPGDVVVDPTGAAESSVTVSQSTDVRTMRGGTYSLYPAQARIASRTYNAARWQQPAANAPYNSTGMRVMLAITE